MELVFEIGCEELPSRFVKSAVEQLEENFRKFTEDNRITFRRLQSYGTPRRLVLIVNWLSKTQDDLDEVRLGPPAAVAFKDGVATGAAHGFAKSQGVPVEELYKVKTEKGEYVAARIREKGLATKELLPGILIRCIEAFHFPKSMRWGTNTKTFARPIRWVLAVTEGDCLKFKVPGYEGLHSGRVTYGHRFCSKKRNRAYKVSSCSKYKQTLEKYDVVLSAKTRRKSIQNQLKSFAETVHGVVINDPGLLEEVVYLVEKPYGVLLEFDKSYLELPDEVLITTMRNNQRYFAIADHDGKLLNACVIIYNSPKAEPSVVRDGNHRVLRARLDDAKFFWKQDLKHSLEEHGEKLVDVTWLNELGSMAERQRRISQLTGKVGELIGLTADEIKIAERAGALSKADLVTAMVFEFTELQGIMGREYALKSGEPEEVAIAIDEQYMPRSADDAIPKTRPGSAVALAEKLDALAGCFGVGLVPTSTADPYALRRAAIGVVKILQHQSEKVSLSELIEAALDVYERNGVALKRERAEIIDDLYEFFCTRLSSLLGTTYPTEIVQAVVAADANDLASVTIRVASIDKIRNREEFESLAAGFKRVVNILKKENKIAKKGSIDTFDIDFGIKPELFREPAERALYDAYIDAETEVQTAIESYSYDAAAMVLIKMKSPIDKFFDEVMVMVEEEEVRENRLSLLAGIRHLFFHIADLSVINA